VPAGIGRQRAASARWGQLIIPGGNDGELEASRPPQPRWPRAPV